MSLNFFGCVCPEPLVTGNEFSHPWWKKGDEAGRVAMSVLGTNHSLHIVRLLEIVPTWRKKSGRDLAEERRNVVNEDENDETSDNSIRNIV